jgi:hypothetical protein
MAWAGPPITDIPMDDKTMNNQILFDMFSSFPKCYQEIETQSQLPKYIMGTDVLSIVVISIAGFVGLWIAFTGKN